MQLRERPGCGARGTPRGRFRRPRRGGGDGCSRNLISTPFCQIGMLEPFRQGNKVPLLAACGVTMCVVPWWARRATICGSWRPMAPRAFQPSCSASRRRARQLRYGGRSSSRAVAECCWAASSLSSWSRISSAGRAPTAGARRAARASAPLRATLRRPKTPSPTARHVAGTRRRGAWRTG